MLTIKNEFRNLSRSTSFHPFNSFNLYTVINAVFICSLLVLFCGCTPAGPGALIQGAKLVQKGRYSQAIERLKIATSLLSTNAQAWNYLGLAYHHAGRADEAEKSYRRALLLNHDLSEAHYNLGCLFLEQKKNDAAKTEFLAYTLRRANSLDALLKLGAAQLRLNELSAAEKSFQDALRLSPQSAEALNGLGCVRAHQRARANEAAGFFHAALKAQANYPPAILNWAIVAQQQSQDRRFALQKYHEYITLKPPPENVQAVKLVVSQLEQELNPHPSPATNPAVHVTTNVAIQRPAPTNVTHQGAAQRSEPPANTARAPANPLPKTLTNNSRPQSSTVQPLPEPDVVKVAPEPVLKSAADSLPLSAPTTVAAGPGSSSDSASAPSANRAQAEQLFAEARRAQQAHHLTDAVNSYRAAAQQDPAYFEAFYNLALVQSEAANVSAAITAYESALAIRPDSLDARYNLALACRQNSDFTRAAVELEKLLQKYPTETRVHLALGNLYAQELHEPGKARPHYLKILEIDPHNPQAGNIRFWLTSNP